MLNTNIQDFNVKEGIDFSPISVIFTESNGALESRLASRYLTVEYLLKEVSPYDYQQYMFQIIDKKLLGPINSTLLSCDSKFLLNDFLQNEQTLEVKVTKVYEPVNVIDGTPANDDIELALKNSIETYHQEIKFTNADALLLSDALLLYYQQCYEKCTANCNIVPLPANYLSHKQVYRHFKSAIKKVTAQPNRVLGH